MCIDADIHGKGRCVREVPKVIALEKDEMVRIIDRSTYTALAKRYGRK